VTFFTWAPGAHLAEIDNAITPGGCAAWEKGLQARCGYSDKIAPPAPSIIASYSRYPPDRPELSTVRRPATSVFAM